MVNGQDLQCPSVSDGRSGGSQSTPKMPDRPIEKWAIGFIFLLEGGSIGAFGFVSRNLEQALAPEHFFSQKLLDILKIRVLGAQGA